MKPIRVLVVDDFGNDAKMLWGVRRAWHFQRRSQTDGAPHAKAKRLQPVCHGI